MPFRFSSVDTDGLAPVDQCVEDRRNNPVKNRKTKFRLMQQNILQYTYPFVPGFADSGINRLPFAELVDQALANAELEGDHRFGADFEVNGNARAKVAGDIFEKVVAAVHWNAAARWNHYMSGGTWDGPSRLQRPSIVPNADAEVVVLSLPRRYDWVRLLDRDGRRAVRALRADLAAFDLGMPTSTPDLLVLGVPDGVDPELFRQDLPDLSKPSQDVLDHAYKLLEGKVPAEEFVLAIAIKRSLRSDRLYQPLYEANVMQLILEGQLAAPQVDFEVHALESSGTRAAHTYAAASLPLVASGDPEPHRAVRELYEPPTANDMVRRFVRFLDQRFGD